jgi:hypothetical protein
VQVSEHTSACLAPEVNEQGEALRSALTRASRPWTRSAAAFGLQLPRACLDPREAAELADEPPGSAASPRCDS